MSRYWHPSPGVWVPVSAAVGIEHSGALLALWRFAVPSQPSELFDVVTALFEAAHAELPTADPGDVSPTAAESPAPLIVNVTEAADILCLEPRTVRLLCQTNRLPAHKIADRWQMTRADVIAYRKATHR